ncbi:hypothetical protein AA313_de0200627 [Arthrobotrys entomopaga]|nr:hypothetical protein AA313_de0200627 [Arthrobotrys entomopaga]
MSYAYIVLPTVVPLNVVPLVAACTVSDTSPLTLPLSAIYIVFSSADMAIPFGWRQVSSTMDTAPVDGLKRYVDGCSLGGVSLRLLNHAYCGSVNQMSPLESTTKSLIWLK